MDTHKRMIKARAGLVLSSPFFASVALYLKLKEDRNYPTAYTDSVVLGYNPDFIEKLTDSEIKFIICHEVMHIVLLHPFRRNNRDQKKWNIACDYAVNPLVQKAGYLLPSGALINQIFDELTAEVIYRKIPDMKVPEKKLMIGDVKDYQQDQSNSASLSPSQQEENWKIKITRAALIAKSQGKLPKELERFVQEVLDPVLPWQEILAGFLTQSAHNDYNWKMPNMRYLHTGLYLPGLNVPDLGTIAVIIDTSASISQKELNQFSAELGSILFVYPATKIKVIYVDSDVAGTETLDINSLELHAKGGGGTDFKPGFEYIEKEQLMPSCAIYFTDGWCRLFPDIPDYPVLWILTTDAKFEPPFGEVIRMN